MPQIWAFDCIMTVKNDYLKKKCFNYLKNEDKDTKNFYLQN